MSFLQAIKIAFIKDIEDTIKKHREMPLGQFTSKIDAAETMAMITAWERAVAHFKLVCNTIEGSQDTSSVSPIPVDITPNVTEGEIVE